MLICEHKVWLKYFTFFRAKLVMFGLCAVLLALYVNEQCCVFDLVFILFCTLMG